MVGISLMVIERSRPRGSSFFFRPTARQRSQRNFEYGGRLSLLIFITTLVCNLNLLQGMGHKIFVNNTEFPYHVTAFMRETSRELTRLGNRVNQTYGGRFHRSLLESPIRYLHAYKYVYRNPVRAGKCKSVQEYPFSSIQGLLGETWLDVPVSEDDR